MMLPLLFVQCATSFVSAELWLDVSATIYHTVSHETLYMLQKKKKKSHEEKVIVDLNVCALACFAPS